MTREEEIKLVASCHIADSIENYKEFYEGFIHGAKWADENQPGMTKMRKDYEFLFMLKKRELIKKACEWMEGTDFNMEYWNSEEGFCKSEFIEGFRKAMEE